jgi:hypothetical protein
MPPAAPDAHSVRASDHDLEYGPTPPDAKHEYTDIDPAIGYKFALWLAVAMVLSFGIVYGTFMFFDSQQTAANAAARRFPLAAGVTRPVPTPSLQTQPFRDIYLLRDDEAKKLQSYGWVDQQGGVARIPIDKAMELMMQRGFPVRAEGADTLNAVTQDSSSGRTVAPR